MHLLFTSIIKIVSCKKNKSTKMHFQSKCPGIKFNSMRKGGPCFSWIKNDPGAIIRTNTVYHTFKIINFNWLRNICIMIIIIPPPPES